MCLLKIYLEEERSKKLIAEGVALIIKQDKNIILKDLKFEEKILNNVEIAFIDTLNSLLILKRRK